MCYRRAKPGRAMMQEQCETPAMGCSLTPHALPTAYAAGFSRAAKTQPPLRWRSSCTSLKVRISQRHMIPAAARLGRTMASEAQKWACRRPPLMLRMRHCGHQQLHQFDAATRSSYGSTAASAGQTCRTAAFERLAFVRQHWRAPSACATLVHWSIVAYVTVGPTTHISIAGSLVTLTCRQQAS